MNLPSGLHEFLDPQCNRAEFIQKYLLDLGLKSTAVVLEGRSHIYVDLPKDCYDSKYKIKTLVAHYDTKVPEQMTTAQGYLRFLMPQSILQKITEFITYA